MANKLRASTHSRRGAGPRAGGGRAPQELVARTLAWDANQLGQYEPLCKFWPLSKIDSVNVLGKPAENPR